MNLGFIRMLIGPAVAAVLLAVSLPAQAADAKAYWHFSGAFHPAVAHFPIALLVVAGVVELFRALRGRKVPGDAGYTCLMLGAAGAVVAAVLGWANADHAGEFNGTQAKVLFLHQWLGTGVAALAVVMAVFATRSRRSVEVSFVRRFGLLLGLLACSGLVGFTGSLGGKLTFGVDYYETVYNETIGAVREAKPAEKPSAPMPTPIAQDPAKAEPVNVKSATENPQNPKPANDPVAAAPTDSASAPTPAAATDPAPAAALARVSYAAHIKPIFVANCTKCHGESKQKGGYRMDAKQFAFEAGDSGDAPIVSGKAEESLLVKVIEGKGEYKDNMMPPKGALLTEQQVALIRRWIDEGAQWDE